MSDIKIKTKSGLKWSAIEKIVTQCSQLVVMLILARIIGPDEFGVIGILLVFTTISQVITDSGFSSALIRKPNCSFEDFNTAFLCNVFIALLIYVIIFFLSSYVANFYEEERITILMRVISLVVIINSFSNVHKAILSKEMLFKTQAKASFSAVIISSLVSIYLAYNEFGVWALVWQNIIFSIVNTIIIYNYVDWFPKLRFSKKSFSYLYGFGSKLLLSRLIDTCYRNIYQLLIGNSYDFKSVGYYTQANQLSSVPSVTFTNIIQRVSYPMLSKVNRDGRSLDIYYDKTIVFSGMFIFPLILGIYSLSDEFVSLFLGNEWLAVATYLKVLCIGYSLYPIHAINLNLLQVKGRSDLFLKLEVIKKSIAFIILLIAINYSVFWVCVGLSAQSFISFFVNTYYTGKLTTLTSVYQIKRILPIWVMAAVAVIMPYYTSIEIGLTGVIKGMFSIIFSIFIYIIMLMLFRKKELFEFVRLAK